MRPGHWTATGLIAAALAADVLLIRRGHEPISTAVRSSKIAKALTLALAAHLVMRIPHDPLHWAGERLTRVPR
jgi:hypothetical protein